MSATVYVVAASRFSFWANANYTRWPLRSYSGLGVAAACPLPFPVLRGGAGCRRAQQGAGAIAGCDLYDALRPKTTEAINLRMMKDGFASMTQEQLDELATSGKHIFFHGLVPPSGLVYVPAGYVIAEACISGSLVHGIRVGFFHCYAVAVQCLRRLADVCAFPGAPLPAAVTLLKAVADCMEKKLAGPPAGGLAALASPAIADRAGGAGPASLAALSSGSGGPLVSPGTPAGDKKGKAGKPAAKAAAAKPSPAATAAAKAPAAEQ